MEKWETVPGYEGSYEASDYGRIRSLPRMVGHNWGGLKRLKGGVLKGIDSNGYRAVTLRKMGKSDTVNVHRLIWISFIGEIEAGLEINHKDGDRSNNKLSNLETISHGDNIRHAFKNGMVPLGEARRHTKLKRKTVLAVRKFNGTIGQISLAFGLNRGTVYDIIHRRTWKHL